MKRLKLLLARLAAAIHRGVAPKPHDPRKCANCGESLSRDEIARGDTWCEECHVWWMHR